MSRYQHRYFGPSLATSPYCTLLFAGLPSYSQYRHRAAVFMFNLDVFMFNLCSSLRRGPQQKITYELAPTSSAMSRMSGSSNLDSFVTGGRWPYICYFVRYCL